MKCPCQVCVLAALEPTPLEIAIDEACRKEGLEPVPGSPMTYRFPQKEVGLED